MNSPLPAETVVHALKCWPEFFGPILDGSKKFEIRKNDRGFKVGDRLRLQEWDPCDQKYTGREVGRVVTYMTGLHQREGYVVLAIGVHG